MLSADDSPPVDRPNLSKDFLAGGAPEDWLPLRPAEFYRDNAIELRLQATVERVHVASREVTLAGGESVPFDRLLLATGAEPVRASIPGTSPSEILVLRSLADCRAIIERAKTAKTVLVLGASFIGLGVAAALRAREIEVHVAAPDTTQMERILGRDLGEFVRALHEQHGVRFHLGPLLSESRGGRSVCRMEPRSRPISSSRVLACARVSGLPNRRASKWTGASLSTPISRRARPHVRARARESGVRPRWSRDLTSVTGLRPPSAFRSVSLWPLARRVRNFDTRSVSEASAPKAEPLPT
jgi:NAD(P)H-nitrite reductase large subunit